MPLRLGLGLTGQRIGSNPADLFAVSGSRGFMFDLSDYGSQFQDTAGTVPITTTGQSVARVNDKSGLGNNMTQATGASMPLTTTIGTGFRGIQFDGVDDWLQTAAVDFSNSDEVTVVAGVRKLSDAAQGVVAELGVNSGGGGAEAGVFGLLMPRTAGQGEFALNAKGTIVSPVTASGFPAPRSAVLSAQAKISTDNALLRVNGALSASSATDLGTGNFGNYPMYLGRRGGATNPFNGVLTFLFVINRLLTANELAAVERFANARTGAF